MSDRPDLDQRFDASDPEQDDEQVTANNLRCETGQFRMASSQMPGNDLPAVGGADYDMDDNQQPYAGRDDAFQKAHYSPGPEQVIAPFFNMIGSLINRNSGVMPYYDFNNNYYGDRYEIYDDPYLMNDGLDPYYDGALGPNIYNYNTYNYDNSIYPYDSGYYNNNNSWREYGLPLGIVGGTGLGLYGLHRWNQNRNQQPIINNYYTNPNNQWRGQTGTGHHHHHHHHRDQRHGDRTVIPPVVNPPRTNPIGIPPIGTHPRPGDRPPQHTLPGHQHLQRPSIQTPGHQQIQRPLVQTPGHQQIQSRPIVQNPGHQQIPQHVHQHRPAQVAPPAQPHVHQNRPPHVQHRAEVTPPTPVNAQAQRAAADAAAKLAAEQQQRRTGRA